MFPLAPPPPGYTRAGPLPAVADAFGAHIAAEERRSWVVAACSLIVTDDGRLGSRHYPTAPMEEEGFRALLVYFNDRFPRATPVLSRLTAPTFAAVWSELFDSGDTRQVRVFERRTGVFAVTPPSFPHDYDASRLVLDVAGLFPGVPVPCHLTYNAASLEVTLVLHFADFDVRVWSTDRHEEKGSLRVTVWTKDGTDLGDPLPAVKKRRRGSLDGGGGTIIDGVAAKIRAAPGYYADRRPAPVAARCAGTYPHTGTWKDPRPTGRRGETTYTCAGPGGCGQHFYVDSSG